MRVIYFTQRGDLLGLALDAKRTGHETLLVSSMEIGKGLVETKKVGILSPLAANSIVKDFKADLAVFDYKGKVADSVRSRGTPTFGASCFGEETHNDIILLKLIDIPVTPFVEEGIPITVTMWFNGNKGLLYYYELNSTRFMDGDLGQFVECSTSVTGAAFPHSKLVKDSVEKLVPILKKASYRAPISISGVITPKGKFRAHSIKTHLCMPSIYAFSELLKDNILNYIHACALGIDIPAKVRIGEVSGAVTVSIPPYPYSIEQDKVFVDGITKENLKHLWLKDIKMEEGNHINGSSSGEILYCTSRGATLNEVKRRIYRTLSGLSIPNVQYRTDIGWHRLKDYEWLITTNLVYSRMPEPPTVSSETEIAITNSVA